MLVFLESWQLADEKLRHTGYHATINGYFRGCKRVDPGSRLILFGFIH